MGLLVKSEVGLGLGSNSPGRVGVRVKFPGRVRIRVKSEVGLGLRSIPR